MKSIVQRNESPAPAFTHREADDIYIGKRPLEVASDHLSCIMDSSWPFFAVHRVDNVLENIIS